MNIHEGSDHFNCEFNGDSDMEEELKVLYLTRDEVLFIDDKLTMMIERDGKAESFTTVVPIVANAGLPSPVDLLDKVGMAVLEATDDDYDNEPVSVTVTATDLYMLREIAKSSVKLNGKYVGLALKRKIYRLLFEEEYRADRTFRKLMSDIDLDLEIEPSQPQTYKIDWSGESG